MKIKKLLALISVLILCCGSSAHSYPCDSVPTTSPIPTASPVATAICTPEPADVRFIL